MDTQFEMFEEFFENKMEISRLNYGTITLIPKLKEANQIQQYKPICLLNVMFKIFSKKLPASSHDVFSSYLPCGSEINWMSEAYLG